MGLFKVSPEVKMTFKFLEQYNAEDEKFFELVSKHSLRVLGIVSKLIKEVVKILRL